MTWAVGSRQDELGSREDGLKAGRMGSEAGRMSCTALSGIYLLLFTIQQVLR